MAILYGIFVRYIWNKRWGGVWPNFHFPSASLFDSLNRISGLTSKHIGEISKKPDEVLLESQVEISPRSKKAETADIYVTDRQLILKSKEPSQIPLCRIDSCSTQISSLSSTMDASHTGETEHKPPTSTFRLSYRDELGKRHKVEFDMSSFDAGSLQAILSLAYPQWYKPMKEIA